MRVFRIIAQKVAVFLDIRATSGSVCDDGFNVCALEGVNHPFRKFHRCGLLARMHWQCSAAGLRLRCDHFATLGCENPRGRRINLREKLALHTAQKQTNTTALGPDGCVTSGTASVAPSLGSNASIDCIFL